MTDSHNDESPESPVDAKFRSIAEAAPEKPAWYKAWSRLGPESTGEERLAVYQAVRDSGLLPEEAGFFLVSLQIDDIATRDAEEDLREYYQAWDEVFAKKLEAFGEQEMARLLRTDRERFEQLTEKGRRYFHGDQEPGAEAPILWMQQLAEAVAEHMTADSAMGPLGYCYGEEEGCWQIDVYPRSVELVGGAVDGEVVAPGFSLDLEGLRAAFDRITDSGWQSLGFPHAEGPNVWIEGVFRGREVFFQVLAYAPEDEEPGMKLDVTNGHK